MEIECLDLFAGAGGLSLGLRRSGIQVRAAIDLDSACKATYLRNHSNTEFLCKDISSIKKEDLRSFLKGSGPLVLSGGPPCQLFSRLNRNSEDNPSGVQSYIRIIKDLRPDYAVFENVPAITSKTISWEFLLSSFEKLKYKVSYGVLAASDFGVPQRRFRLIVIASRWGFVDLPKGRSRKCTVRKAIGHLPSDFGYNSDHVGLNLSPHNLKRIQSISEGEISRSIDSSFSDSYSRMSWDELAPTITTKCISFSNGRFGHPTYDRAISVHEASLLQGFPRSYRFEGTLAERARQVGNAVPPPVGKAIGDCIHMHAMARC